MNTIFIIGLMTVILSILAARRISESALHKLTHDQVISIERAFSGYRRYSLIMLLPLAVGIAVFILNYTEYYPAVIIFFFISLFLYFSFAYFFAARKLKEMGYPSDYIRSVFLSFAVRVLGIAVFCGLMIYSYYVI